MYSVSELYTHKYIQSTRLNYFSSFFVCVCLFVFQYENSNKDMCVYATNTHMCPGYLLVSNGIHLKRGYSALRH